MSGTTKSRVSCANKPFDSDVVPSRSASTSAGGDDKNPPAPSGALASINGRAHTLEALVAKAGFKNIQIEAGPVGLVVYGPTQTSVAQVAAKMAEFAKLFDTHARAEAVCVDADEAPTSRFIATVRFDWNALSQEAA